MNKVLLFVVLLISTAAFAQRNIDQELLVQTPNCENVAFNSSRLIEHYFGQKKYDSINVVFNRWEEFCGTTEPLFRLKVLYQIQIGKYSEEWMDKEYLMNFIYLYLDRLDYSKQPNAKLIYERYKISFGYITFNSPFDDLTVIWANSLLERDNLLPAERAFCLLYSNQTEAFWQMMKNKQLSGTKLQEEYALQVGKTKKMVEGNFGFMTGLMLPFGNLKDVVGVKPIFGFQFGMKQNKLQYDLTMLLRSGKTKQEYLIMYQGEPKMTDYYFGGYVGLDVDYELWKNKKKEFDLLTGIAYDGFDAVESDTEKNIKGKSINSLNLNLGLGLRFYGKGMNYWGVQTKYNIVNYINNQGTDFSGDYVSLIVSYNFFGNIRKRSMMERLQMK
jgi:hypothetical protein